MEQVEWEALNTRQRDRESAALAEGARRFKQQLAKEAERGDYARSPVAKKLLQQGIEPLETAITEWITAAKKVRGVKHVSIKWLDRIGIDIAAYMTLKVVLDGITKRRDYTTVCESISGLISDELRYRILQEQAPALFEYKMKHFRTSSYKHMARSLDHTMRTAKTKEGEALDAEVKMPRTERFHVGAKLVHLLITSTGLIDVVTVKTTSGKGKQHTRKYLETSPETTEWLTKRADDLARHFLQAQNLPMVMQPLEWGPGKGGGYRFALNKYPLVRGVIPELRKELSNRDMPMVYSALNTLQNTRWKINRAVYDLVREIEHLGGGFAGIAHTEIQPLPPRPRDIDTNEEARAKWRKAAGQAKDANHIRKMRGRELQRVLDSAAGVLDEPGIYFPYSLDFRGRVYPIADYLHPQGHDLAKALLTFATGKPIEEDGARWLAIHGANCLGETPQGKVSKMTLDDRVQWVHQHTKQIMQAASDPFANKWWAEADDPLQFFAFCVEWTLLIEANARGAEYICSLPVAIDGSCNGLQHFSAMFRDEVGGAAVNVMPQETPQDIYERVAENVLDQLAEMSDDPLALKLLATKQTLGKSLVNRKLTKRPTMTFGYGSKRYGFKMQLKDYLRGLDNWHEVKALFTTQDATGKEKSQINAVCGLLAACIWNSLGSVVVKAAEGMKWMQEAARGIVKTSKAVEWIVPETDFRVRQDYCQWKKRRIQTVLAGSTNRPVRKGGHKKAEAYIKIDLHEPTDKIDPIRQVNAVAPNIVHSLDAAALVLTVTQAFAEGVESFAMVHDSYGVLPGDCSVLARCCRQSFVRLYTTCDVVKSLHEQFSAQAGPENTIPDPPAKGKLDVNAVLASDYFFS